MTMTDDRPLVSLWAEVTGKCQLECVHCYAGSSPDGTHGTMTADQWKAVLAEAAALGTRAVCFIGGEPTLYPDLPELVRHALSRGMQAEVYTNLVFVSAKMWELFALPGVSVATSWYSSDREEHKQVTGRDTWRQTLANIDKAVQRGIPLRVGLIDGIIPGQHVQEGAMLLRERGVVNIGTDYLREFGRGTTCDAGQACGNCGQGRAAVLPDGTVAPCPLTRWMDAGNVADAPLAAILADVVRLADTIPAVQARRKPVTGCHPWASCKPDDCPPLNPCGPDKAVVVQQCTPSCPPAFCSPHCRPNTECQPENHVMQKSCIPHECPPDVCKPLTDACRPDNRVAVPAVVALTCNPDDCRPDTFCAPLCTPSACRPNVRMGKDCLPDDCRPDTFCPPLCTPSECRPNVECRPDSECRPNRPL